MKQVYKYLIICILVVCIIFAIFNHSSYTLPKIVWSYWDTDERPELIQQIHTYNVKHLDGWTVKFLNKKDLAQYIHPSSYPIGYDKLKPAHQADWIRLYLLSKYGGVWMDASIVLNDGSALNRLYQESIQKQSQFTGFTFKNDEPKCRSPRGISLYVENWFIMAPKGSSVVYAWNQEYEKAIQMGFLEYRHELERRQVDTHLIYGDKMDTYLTQHACFQAVVQKQFYWLPSMIFLQAEDSMFKLHMKCKFDPTCTIRLLRDEPDQCRALPYIKLRGPERETGIDLRKFFHAVEDI